MTEYLVILTVQFPYGTGFSMITRTDVVQAGPGDTRATLLAAAQGRVPEYARDGNVIFFSAEPNILPTGPSPVRVGDVEKGR